MIGPEIFLALTMPAPITTPFELHNVAHGAIALCVHMSFPRSRRRRLQLKMQKTLMVLKFMLFGSY